uniref:Cytochrome P450 n=1 Tax=Leptobrachium leishanense TaxID=445787 RepID=A0A8C5WMA6_9ANUR
MFDVGVLVVAVVAFVTFLLALPFVKHVFRRQKMPPGPFALPIIGNLWQLRPGNNVQDLLKLNEKYGPVFTVYFGSRRAVVVAGYQAVKELLIDHGDSVLNRGEIPVFFVILDNKGMSLLNGDKWKQLRHFSLLTLRDFGMGKKNLEEPIQAEAQHMVTYFRNQNQQPVNPANVLTCASSNLLSAILMDMRYEYEDKKWMKNIHNMHKGFNIYASFWGQLYDMFPSLMKRVPGPHQKIFKYLQGLKDGLMENINRHFDSLDPANPRDYVDCFLIRMEQFGEKYGSVYTIYFGPKPVVVLCGYQAVKEALIDQGEEFSNRGAQASTDDFVQGFGVVFSNGERWKQLRRFSLSTLRNFGMGKRTIEERIQEEAQFLVAELRSYKGKSFDPTSLLVQCVSNVISFIVFGSRFEYNNKSLQKLLCLFEATFREMSSSWGQLKEMFPKVMQYVPGPHHRIYKHLENLLEFVSERVKTSQENLDPNTPQNYIDVFLIKMQQENQNPASQFIMRNLLITVLNLFFAGTETVSTTLRHGLLILLKYPEVEEKIVEEIDRVIGHDRSPNIEDRSKMPYTDAVIHEIQRFSDVIPMSVPHAVTKDVTFRGYNIPKGTDVYPLLCSVLRDPTQFATPFKFNPNHFLDEHGQFKKSDAFMPFSTGKRICLGEGLARMELFLFLTTLLQTFKLSSRTQFTEEDIAPKTNGFANYPTPYQLSFIPR